MTTKRHWTLQDAKARFSEVVRAALESGPQFVTRSGSDAVVIVATPEFERLTPGAKRSVGALLAASPLSRVDLDIERAAEPGRRVTL